jgi:hypothetical protein
MLVARLMCGTVPSTRSLADYGRRVVGSAASLLPAPVRHHRVRNTQRDLVVNQRITHPGKFPPLGRRASPPDATASGIEVHEEKWGTATVQHVYKMRCECGRSWFELELPRFVKCPACHKLDYVST